MNARKDPRQFGSFGELGDRKDLAALFRRLGDPLPEEMKRGVRAAFLRSLIGASTTGMAGAGLRVEPCDATQAYLLFVHICGVLGVEIEGAAKKLERWVRGDTFKAVAGDP